MTKIFFTVSILLTGLYNGRDVSQDNAALLTGGNHKAWQLVSHTPEQPGATCKSSHPIASDNMYTFFADGSFSFDHGSITEDQQCDNEDCCSDMVNMIGTWKFANSGKGLVIKVLYEKENPDNKFTLTLFSATIEQLNENVLRFNVVVSETGVKNVFEFHKL